MCKHLLRQLEVWPNEIPDAAVMEYLSRHNKPRINSVCWVVQISTEQTENPLKLKGLEEMRPLDNTTVV